MIRVFQAAQRHFRIYELLTVAGSLGARDPTASGMYACCSRAAPWPSLPPAFGHSVDALFRFDDQ